MADPQARFVLTARDQTAAAFRSADKSLKQLQSSARATRRLFGAFGVAFTARAFAGWIRSSLDAADATGANAEALARARQVVKEYDDAWTALGQTIATKVSPAFELLGRSAEGWRKALAPTESEAALEKFRELTEAQAKLTRMEEAAQEGGFRGWLHRTGMDLEAQREIVARLRAEHRALGMEVLSQSAAGKPYVDVSFTDDELVKTEAMLSKLFGDIEKERSQLLQRTAAEETATETMLFDLFRDIEAEKLKIRQDEFDSMWTNLQAELEIYDEIAERSIDAAKESGTAWDDFAQTAGFSIRNTLVDAFMGVETSFRDLLRRMLAEFAVSGLFEAFGALASGGTGTGAKFFSSFFGGSLAMTGPVEAGKIYKVHRGEAFFAPGEDGRVGRVRDGSNAAPTVHVHQHIEAGLPPQWTVQFVTAGQMAASAAYDAVTSRLGGKR